MTKKWNARRAPGAGYLKAHKEFYSRKSTPLPPITQGPHHISHYLRLALAEIAHRQIERRAA